MKHSLYIGIAAFVLIASRGGCEPPLSFDHYKQLSKEERVQLAKTGEAVWMQCFEWDQRLKAGEEGWKEHQETRLALQKEVAGLSQLFGEQGNLWALYYQQSLDAAAKKPNTTKQAQKDECEPILKLRAKIDTENYKDNYWYLVKLARTPDASVLDKKADELGMKWYRRFPLGETHVITREDLKELDAEVEAIRQEMRKLPQWTSEEEDAAIQALPPEGPTRSWPINPMKTR